MKSDSTRAATCSSRAFRSLSIATRAITGVFLSLTLAACSSPLDPTSAQGSSLAAEFGQVAFALTAETESRRFALRDAQFSVTGSESVVLASNDAPDATALVQDLESGEYTVELLPGYRLVELLAEGEVDVEATLATSNPQSVLIAPDQTTSVTFIFRTAAEAVPFGDGTLEVFVAVEQAAPVGLFFSELMLNPLAMSDAEGEWMEITNSADVPLDLQGCSITRDSSSFVVDQSLVVPPGEAVTLANSVDPGFVPDFTYSSLTLPNSSLFVLSLQCNGQEWDSVTIDPATFPVVAGASSALDADRYSADENDEPAAWCVSQDSFGSDLGTPGRVNASCTLPSL